MNKKHLLKVFLIAVAIILFVGTLPAVFLNSRKIDQAKESAQVILDEASKVCSSNCTDYPDEWVIEDKEAEAELYCMRQCTNDMEAMRNEINKMPLIEFENQYTLRVAQLYCLLGLRCYATEIEDYVNNY